MILDVERHRFEELSALGRRSALVAQRVKLRGIDKSWNDTDRYAKAAKGLPDEADRRHATGR